MPEDILNHALFAGPALLLSVVCFVVPIILNPHILGWPFLRKRKPKKVYPGIAPSEKNQKGRSRSRDCRYSNIYGQGERVARRRD